MTPLRKHVVLLALLLAAGWSTSTLADTPLSYSGRLTDATGKPLAGPVDLEIRFFDSLAATTGQLGTTVTKNAVVLQDGIFQVELTPDLADVFGDGSGAVYVDVKANGKPYPRQRFTAVPYALRVPVDGKTLGYDEVSGKLQINAGAVTGGYYLKVANDGTVSWQPALGAGDMEAVTYDNAGSVANGKVDLAEDSEKLNGQSAAFYATATHNHDSAYAALSHSHGSADIDAYADLAAATKIGTGAAQVAAGNHNHDAAYSLLGHTHTKADVGLGSVENTALSTWTGSSNVTTLGTIGAGTWHGAAIADSYIASATAWNLNNAKVSSQWTTIGSDINFAGDNVGIGSGSPVGKLDVNGHVAVKTLQVGPDGWADPNFLVVAEKDGTTNGLTGVWSYVKATPTSGSGGTVNAFEGMAFAAGAQNFAAVRGAYLSAGKLGAGTVDDVRGAWIDSNISAGTATASHGLYVNAGGVATIGSNYGILIDNSSQGGGITNNYGLFIDDQSGAGSTNSFNFYSVGASAKNHFAGYVGIATTGPFDTTGCNGKLCVAGGALNMDDTQPLTWGGGTGRASITGSKAGGTMTLALPSASAATNKFNFLDGKVGIGSANPQAKLDVAGAAGTDGIRFPDGTLQTTAFAGGYQVQCENGQTSGYAFCCRVNRSNGAIVCKYASVPGAAWTTISPDPFTATTTGAYGLSVMMGYAGNHYPGVCRTNEITGATHCRSTNSWTAPSAWGDYANDPF